MDIVSKKLMAAKTCRASRAVYNHCMRQKIILHAYSMCCSEDCMHDVVEENNHQVVLLLQGPATSLFTRSEIADPDR
jgi:hypothetical protein